MNLFIMIAFTIFFVVNAITESYFLAVTDLVIAVMFLIRYREAKKREKTDEDRTRHDD